MALRTYFHIFIILILLPAQVMAAPSPAATRETKRVLVIYSLDKGHPAHGLTEQGISEVFRANREFDVRLYPEYLDMGRFPGPAQAGAMAEFLRRKYADTRIDAIIAVYQMMEQLGIKSTAELVRFAVKTRIVAE